MKIIERVRQAIEKRSANTTLRHGTVKHAVPEMSPLSRRPIVVSALTLLALGVSSIGGGLILFNTHVAKYFSQDGSISQSSQLTLNSWRQFAVIFGAFLIVAGLGTLVASKELGDGLRRTAHQSRSIRRSLSVEDLAIISLLCIIFSLACLWVGAWTLDDAYISFRYSQNLAEGHGLVWNPGETRPTEGYTNFSLVTLVAVGLLAGIPPETVAHSLGFISGIVSIILIYLSVRELSGRRVLPVVFAGSYAIAPELPLHSLSGMETQLFVALLALQIYLVLHYLGRKTSNGNGLLIALALCSVILPMTRPEGILFSLFTFTFLIATADRPERRRLIVIGSFFFLLPAILYMWFRLAYFGYVFPNTFYVKSVQYSSITDFFTQAPNRSKEPLAFFSQSPVQTISLAIGLYLSFLLLFLPLDKIVVDEPQRRVYQFYRLLVFLGLFVLMYYTFFSEPATYWGRFYFHISSLLMLIGGLSLILFPFLNRRSVLAILLLLALLPYPLYGKHVREYAASYRESMKSSNMELGRILRQSSPKSLRLSVTISAGAIPYLAGLRTLDTHGLTNAEIGQLRAKILPTQTQSREILRVFQSFAPNISVVNFDHPSPVGRNSSIHNYIREHYIHVAVFQGAPNKYTRNGIVINPLRRLNQVGSYQHVFVDESTFRDHKGLINALAAGSDY